MAQFLGFSFTAGPEVKRVIAPNPKPGMLDGLARDLLASDLEYARAAAPDAAHVIVG